MAVWNALFVISILVILFVAVIATIYDQMPYPSGLRDASVDGKGKNVKWYAKSARYHKGYDEMREYLDRIAEETSRLYNR